MSSRLRLCALAAALMTATAPSAALAQDDAEPPAGPPLLGKFGCSESVYNGDFYESEPRGFVTLLSGRRYRQGKGRVGRYRYKAATGVTSFRGGGLDGSTATGIDGKRTRLFITVRFDDGEEANWACTHLKKG